MTAPRCLHPPRGKAAERAASLCALLPEIETPRLRLRAPLSRDFAAWAEIFAAPDSDYPGGRRSAEEAWQEFSVYVASWIFHGHGLWTVTLRNEDIVLGFVLAGLEWSDRAPELGYMLRPAARRRGYAFEAARAVLDHESAMFGDLGLVSYVHPENHASVHLAERLGANRDAAAEAELGDGTQVWRHGGAA